MFSASDLEGRRFDAPKFVIPSLVPEGVTLLSGTPKIGKSWMLLNMGVGVATGGFVLDQVCVKGPVLYLALEDNPRRLQQRLLMMMPEESFPPDLHFSCEWNRFPVGLRDLEKIISEFDLVMIDTLEMIRPPRRSNPYEDDYRALAGLRDLARSLRTAVVVVHHNRKTETSLGGEDIDPIERVSGTMGLTGCVDTILVLSRFRGTSVGELFVMGRDIVEQRLTVKLVGQHGLWTVHSGY